MSNRTFKRGRLSPDEVEQISKLGERLTGGQIALKLNRHPSTVSYALRRLGIGASTPATNRKPYLRGGVLVVPFSPEEDAVIERLRTEGLGPQAIAERISAEFGHPRSQATISTRLTYLACAAEDDV